MVYYSYVNVQFLNNIHTDVFVKDERIEVQLEEFYDTYEERNFYNNSVVLVETLHNQKITIGSGSLAKIELSEENFKKLILTCAHCVTHKDNYTIIYRLHTYLY